MINDYDREHNELENPGNNLGFTRELRRAEVWIEPTIRPIPGRALDCSCLAALIDGSLQRMERLGTLFLLGTPLVELTLQSLIFFLQIQHHVNASQIEAIIQELGYHPEPLEVVLAIETSPALAAGGSDQPSSFIEPQVLWSVTDQARSHRDAVYPP